jgi:hypothetical protein
MLKPVIVTGLMFVPIPAGVVKVKNMAYEYVIKATLVHFDVPGGEATVRKHITT